MHAHRAVGEHRLFDVVALVVRGEPVGGDLRAQVQHGIERLPRVFGEPLAFAQIFDVEPVVEQEVEILAGEQMVGGHGVSFSAVKKPVEVKKPG